MRGVNVACVVLLVGYELDPILLVRNNITETVALCVFGQSCCGENTVCPLLGHLLILSEDPLLFQLQLQGLTLERQRKKGVLVIEYQATHHSEVSLSVPKGLSFVYIPPYLRDYSGPRIQKSHYNIRLRLNSELKTDNMDSKHL